MFSLTTRLMALAVIALALHGAPRAEIFEVPAEPPVAASGPAPAASVASDIPPPVVEVLQGRVSILEHCKGSTGKGASYGARVSNAIADISSSSFLGRLGQMAIGAIAGQVAGNAMDDSIDQVVYCVTLTMTRDGKKFREKFEVPGRVYEREVIRIGKKYDVTFTDGKAAVYSFH